MKKVFYVYMLRMQDGTLYVGHTGDLISRLIQHSKGIGSRYTKGRKFKQLEYFETYNTRSEAMKREKELKRKDKQYKEELSKTQFCLFSYGSLSIDRIQRKLFGRTPLSAPAKVHGYKILKLRTSPFPLAAKEKGGVVYGKILMGLSHKDILAADEWEGDDYIRVEEKAVAPWGKQPCFMYVANKKVTEHFVKKIGFKH